MKLSNVAAIWWIRLRARLGQELLALAGIAVGVSLLFAALVANTSLVGSFEQTMRGLVGDARFQLTARGGGTLDEATVASVRRLEGVEAAAGVLEIRTQVTGPSDSRALVLLGVTPDFVTVNRRLAQRFSADYLASQRVIALPAPFVEALDLALGQRIALNIDGVDTRARLAVQLTADQIGPLANSPVGVAPLRYAQELANRPAQVTRIFVLPKAGSERAVEAGLRRLAAARLDVRAADFEAALFRQASEPSSQSTAMFSAFSAMVGFLFAFSAVLLTVPARRSMISELLVEGYSGRSAMQVMAFDALVLGVAASTVGILLGDQVSRQLFASPPSFLELAFPFGSGRIVTAESVIVAAVGGILASCAAVLMPAAGAIRDERAGISGGPSGRTRRSQLRWLSATGAAALGGGLVIVVVAPASIGLAVAGLLLLAAGMLLLLPWLLQTMVATLDALAGGVRSVVPYVALTDLRSAGTQARALAVAATGAVAVFGSVALQGAHADLQRGLDRTSVGLAAIGDVWAVPPGSVNLLATIAFSEPLLLPPDGIQRLDGYRGSFLDVGDRRIWALGVPTESRRPVPRGQVLAGDASDVDRRIREGGWVLLSRTVADELDVGVGDTVVLPTAVPTPLKVAALTTNMGWPPGAVVLNADDYARAWGSDAISAVHATLAPGITPEEGARRLRAALPPSSGLEVQTAAEREQDQRVASREGLVRLNQIAQLVLISAVIAMAAAMTGLIWQRRSFLASVKLEGYSTSELWRSIVVQAAFLVGAGCLVGAAFGLLGQRLLSRALTEITGFPISYALAGKSAIATCLIVTAGVVIVVGVFGLRAARVDPGRDAS